MCPSPVAPASGELSTRRRSWAAKSARFLDWHGAGIHRGRSRDVERLVSVLLGVSKHETIRTSRPFSAQFVMVGSLVVLSCSFTLNSAGRFLGTLLLRGSWLVLEDGWCVVHFYTLIVFVLLQSNFARDAAREVGTRLSKTAQSPTNSVKVIPMY